MILEKFLYRSKNFRNMVHLNGNNVDLVQDMGFIHYNAMARILRDGKIFGYATWPNKYIYIVHKFEVQLDEAFRLGLSVSPMHYNKNFF